MAQSRLIKWVQFCLDTVNETPEALRLARSPRNAAGDGQFLRSVLDSRNLVVDKSFIDDTRRTIGQSVDIMLGHYYAPGEADCACTRMVLP